MNADHGFGRRTLLLGAGVAAAGLAAPGMAWGLIRTGRPVLTHGVQTRDVGHTGALLWSRADRPARMLVELALEPSFRHPRRVRGPVLTPDTDGHGQGSAGGAAAGAGDLLPGSGGGSGRAGGERAADRVVPDRAGSQC